MTALLVIVPLFVVTAIAAGAVLTARLGLRAGDRLTVAVGASLMLVFTAWWCLWIAGVPAARCSLAVAVATGACAVVGWRQIRRLVTTDVVQWQAAGFAAVACHALLLHAVVFSYSGGLWGGDWCSHFTQAAFFVNDGDPRPNRFPAGDAITARPPLMNILAAHFCGLVPATFADYQVVMTLLSAVACLPAFMVADRLAVRFGVDRRWAVVAASAALIVLPAFAENAVYPWTKLLTAFFVIAGLVLWGDGVDHVSRPHRLLAAILLAGGLLTHYSAAVYVVAAVLHEAFLLVVAVVRRRDASGIGATLRANILAAAAAVAVCVPWIGWAVGMFGIEGTFATNTAVVDAAVYTPMGNIAKVLLNIRDTLVPSFLRPDTELVTLLRRQPHLLGRVRDLCFLPYQVDFPAALGVVGWWATPLAIGLLWKRLGSAASRGYWVTLLGVGFVLGVAAHGGRDQNGLAHICLQPVMLLGAVLLAVVLPRLAPGLQVAVVTGWTIDYLLGTLLQAYVESWRFVPGDPLRPGDPTANSAGLSLCATSNLLNKQELGVVFLADRVSELGIEPVQLLGAAFAIGAGSLAGLAWRLRSDGMPAGPKKV